MEPPPKAAASPVTSSGAFEEPQSAQYGRSATSLHAELSAAALRKEEHRTADPPAAAPSSPGTNQPTPPQLTQSHDNRLRTPQSPPTSSPLTSSASSDSIEDGERDGNQKSAGNGISQNGGHGRSLSQPPPRPPPPQPAKRRSRLDPNTASDSPRNSGSILTMRDLGSDYTRYFNFSTESVRTPPSRKGGALRVPGTPVNPFSTPNVSTTRLDSPNPDFDAEKHGFLVDDRLTTPYNEKGTPMWPLFNDKEEGMMMSSIAFLLQFLSAKRGTTDAQASFLTRF